MVTHSLFYKAVMNQVIKKYKANYSVVANRAIQESIHHLRWLDYYEENKDLPKLERCYCSEDIHCDHCDGRLVLVYLSSTAIQDMAKEGITNKLAMGQHIKRYFEENPY